MCCSGFGRWRCVGWNESHLSRGRSSGKGTRVVKVSHVWLVICGEPCGRSHANASTSSIFGRLELPICPISARVEVSLRGYIPPISQLIDLRVRIQRRDRRAAARNEVVEIPRRFRSIHVLGSISLTSLSSLTQPHQPCTSKIEHSSSAAAPLA